MAMLLSVLCSFCVVRTVTAARRESSRLQEPDFAIKPGYKCELQAKAWCAPPAVNPGQQYRKNGKVMCCSKLEATEAVTAESPMERESQEDSTEVTPKEETTTEAPPKEETTTEAAVEPEEPDFAIKPGYKCELQAKAWCSPPAVNPGQQYRKNGKVMCCSKLEATEAGGIR
ncbi:lss, partial [Symbiodinium sp. CCMP2592]